MINDPGTAGDSIFGETPNPDLAWYEDISERKFLKKPRCPFASVERCPRFYQSLSLLESVGSTAIDKAEDKRLKEKWERHHLWPRTTEQATSIGNTSIFNRFCPEVSFERFGVFASDFARYADETDLELAGKVLDRHGVLGDSWRRIWSSLKPMHYSNCPLFSPLLHDSSPLESQHKMFEWKLSWHGLSVDLKEVFCWLRRKLGGK